MILAGTFNVLREPRGQSFYAVCLTVRDGMMLAWKRG